MSKSSSNYTFQHGSQEKLGVLLVNLGSPDAPEAPALKRYLAQFLWDPRVVERPRWLWWLILHGIILRIRPRRSAKAYKKVWTDQGSPLIAISRHQARAVEQALQKTVNGNIIVDLAMSYGNPSIKDGLHALRRAGAARLVILPMYPQYSATTTAAVFDEVTRILKQWRWVPELRFINHYHDHPAYISALANSVRHHRKVHDSDSNRLLMFSFHGIPQSYVNKGDPYFCHCQKTARLVAEALQLADENWQVVFQSRFGREPWLQPYCDKTLQKLPSQGVKKVDVICPGFSADCLETLEEINMENRHLFLDAGGETFQYIPALNVDEDHINALCELISSHSSGWPETSTDWDAGQQAVEEKKSRERALKMGAKK